MGRESAGAIYVSIDGDSSPLLAKYQQVEAQSRAAGQRIATGLGQGFQQASGILDQFGRVVQSGVIRPLDQVAPAAARATSGIKQIAAAAEEAEGKTQSFVGVIPGLGRAAEHFINLLPGVGSAIMAAFPVLGAIALTQNLKGMGTAAIDAAKDFLFLADAQKEAERVGQEAGTVLEKSAEHIRDLTVEILRDQGKLILAAQQAQFNDTQKFIHLPQPDKEKLSGLADDDLNKVKSAFANVLPADVGDRVRQVKQDLADAVDLMRKAQSNSLGPLDFFSQHTASQAQATVQLLGSALQALRAEGDQFDAEQVAGTARVGKAREEEAKKAADEAKRAAAEVKRQQAEEKRLKDDAFRQAREFMALERKGQKITSDETKARVKDETRDMMANLREYASDFEREQELERREIVATTAAKDRANQELIRAQGIGRVSNDEVQLLKSQATYSIQVAHTKAEELAHVIKIADLEDKILEDRIKSLKALRDYQSQHLLPTESTDIAIANAQADRDAAKVRSDAEKERARKRARIGGGLEDIAAGIPGQLGGALASGLSGGHIGQEIKQALQGIGKEMMGDVFKDLIAAMVGNSLVTLANTAATELNTFWLAIKSFVGGLLGFAGGGRPAPGVPYIVGENGPEVRIDDGPGVILPSVPRSGGLSQGSSLLTASQVTHSSSRALSIGAIHLHGIQNAEQFARAIPSVMKSRAPNFSPASR